jgi:glycerol kinase
LLADLARRPVTLTATPDAATLGAARLAGVASGWWALAGAARGNAAPALKPAEPDPYSGFRERFQVARGRA